MIVRILVFCGLLSGCAGSFRALQGAPEWYEQRREEIVGTGYPRIAEIPEVAPATQPGVSLQAERLDLGDAETEFMTHPRAQPPTTTLKDMEDFVTAAMDEFEPVSEPADTLSPAEVEAMRRIFDRYPVGG